MSEIHLSSSAPPIKPAATMPTEPAMPPSTRPSNPNPDIPGYCPMGCGRTLFAAVGGHITCSYIHCPRPTAVDDLLEDQETDHLVTFDVTGFTVRHPLRERLDDALMSCRLHEFCAGLDGPPALPGLYRVAPRFDGSGRWVFLAVDR
jgi:hypothetical protein